MTMKAEIIAVGSELLTPDKIDTNSLFLTEELNKLGIEIVRKTVVGDDRALLMEAFRDAVNRVPLIISSGGLGPTEDDITRDSLARPAVWQGRYNLPLLGGVAVCALVAGGGLQPESGAGNHAGVSER